MKIALLGYGKTGSVVGEIALSRGHSLLIIDPLHPQADLKELGSVNLASESLAGIDVCIDFSRPDSVLDNISIVSQLKRPIIIGTTGWYSQLDQVKKIILSNNSALLYATNFSIGVMILNRILDEAAKIINKFDNYDVAATETHHNQKMDSPSGTAETIAKILLANIERKTKLTTYVDNHKIEPNELLLTSLRCGSVPGTHEVIFDSPADTISIKHTARNRTGFALGAVLAAEWIKDKSGFFTIEDYFNDFIGRSL